MKSKVIGMAICLMLMTTVFGINVSAEDPVLDQYCHNEDDCEIMQYSSNWYVQSFIPTKNVLTKVSVKLSKLGTDIPDSKMVVVVLTDSLTDLDNPIHSLASGGKRVKDLSDSPTWYNLNPSSPINLDTNKEYYILVRLLSSIEPNEVQWHGSHSNECTSGQAYQSSNSGQTWSNAESCVDLNFETYGYNEGGDTTYYDLNIYTEGCGDVTLSPPGVNYEEGTQVTLTANPCNGWRFDQWNGDATGTTNPKTITMNSNKYITAVFAEKDTGPTDYYALLIGVGNYPGEDDDLTASVGDALAMQSALTTGSNWRSENIRVLTDDSATIDNAYDELEWLINSETENDISIIYFAGHGIQINDDDGDENDGLDECLILQDNILIDDDLQPILDNFDGMVLVILDACYSGGMPCTKSKISTTSNANEKIINEFISSFSGQGRVIFMACGEDQESATILVGEDSPLNHGLFTMGILSGLHGSADDNNDNDITIEECYNYAKNFCEENQKIFFNEIISTVNADPDPFGEFSDIEIVKGITNNPPEKPSKPSGETNGKVNVKYNYYSTVSDPDKDKLEVFFYWDDSNFAVFSDVDSGSTLEVSYSWENQFNYDIRVIAADEHGAISEWSDPLSVSMPLIKEYRGLFFRLIIEKIPFIKNFLETRGIINRFN